MPDLKTPADRLMKQPRQIRIPIVGDEEVADRLELAEAAYLTALRQQAASRLRRIAEHRDTGSEDPSAVADAEDEGVLGPLRAEISAATEELDKVTLWFVFQSIGRKAWARLVAEHPPTDEDHAQARLIAGDETRSAAWHSATLLPAAIQASCVSPVLTGEDLDEMYEGAAWNDAELGALAGAALSVNTQARTA